MIRGCYRIYPKGICLKSGALEGGNLVLYIHLVGPDVHINVEDQKSFCEALHKLQKLKNEIDDARHCLQ